MKIFFYRYGSICEPDFIDGFRKLGFEIDTDDTEIYNKTVSAKDSIKRISNQLINNNYSFVFSINFYPWLSDLCSITGLKYLCQIVDSPILELYSPSIRNANNRIFIFDREQYNDFYSENPDCIFHMPLSANTDYFTQYINSSDEAYQLDYSCDISFIGSTYQEKCPLNSLVLSDNWKGYIDGLVESQLCIYGYNFIRELIPDELIKDIRTNNPDIYQFPDSYRQAYKEMIADQFISVKVGEQERLRALKMLSDKYNLNIYTGSDTTQLPHIHNKGYAKSRTQMPLIFRNSKINLNITAKSIRSGLSQRIFDVLGCQGFLITNYQSELSDYFEIGKDLVAYTSLKELDELCAYYLAHEDERMEIALNGYKKVLSMHTLSARILQMLKTIA